MSPEQSIAHYRIISKLGEGGMGAVYRATDTKLNRDVAIKVLPTAFASDAGRMQRFEREAQLLASLNHPNIAAIYGVEQGAIVMELVEGASPAGPLPIDTVIDYARQIATGLEAAHEKGIVHRDLKPANIKITPEGVVKLLDFGLAKAREETASSVTASPTMSPTISMAMTQAGVILGTAAYMSPEQARGKAVDRRADIWAYGVILYEFLTGRNPYGAGETVTDTLAAIVLKEPDLGALPAETPARLRGVIERCLRKDPKTRLRDIGEARVLLDEPEAPAAAAAISTPAARRRNWLPWSIAAAGLVIAGAALGFAWMRSRASDPGPGAAHFVITLPPDTRWPNAIAATGWVPSPDGHNIVMAARDSQGTFLWVRPLNGMSAHKLDKTENASFPFWSPDGQHIGFFADGKIKRVPMAGGAVQRVCDLPESSNGDGAAWNKDGVIVFGINRHSLFRVAATSGAPKPATTLAKNETDHTWPQFLPDGRHLLYLSRGGTDGGIYVQELGSSKRIRVLESGTRAMYAPPGYLLFTRDGSLFAQSMNTRTYQLEGEPVSVAEEVVVNEVNGRSTFAVSQNGVLVYRSGRQGDLDRQISWRDRAGKVLKALGKPGRFTSLRLSPDERSLALCIRGSIGRLDLWIMDLATGVISPMTHEGSVAVGGAPIWSPDSTRVAVSTREGIEEITVASGQTRLLTKERMSAEDWTPDGRAILCQERTGTEASLLAVEGGKVQPVLTVPHRQGQYAISPDGKLVAYYSTEAGTVNEIFVATFPTFSVKRRISPNGGNYPFWSKDGKSLFYRTGDGTLAEVPIRAGAGIESGDPKTLFKFGSGPIGNRFAVSGDGQRVTTNEYIVAPATVAEAFELQVVVNWPAAMK